jgi:hypothetical protein
MQNHHQKEENESLDRLLTKLVRFIAIKISFRTSRFKGPGPVP